MKHWNPNWIRCFVAVLAIFFACALCRAQILYGTITGNVTDPSGLAVPGAAVEVANTGTGIVKKTTSNDAGTYLFSDLQPGVYKVTITSPAFAQAVQDGVNVTANQSRRVDAMLQVAKTSSSVIVSGTAETLQTDRADVNTNITSTQVANLPVTGSTGRNFQSLIALVPGAVSSGEQNSAAGNPQRSISFNVNGVSRLQNNTRIDGSSDNYPWLPTNVAYVPPIEAIQTVNIVTNAFTAEQGLAGGAEINVFIRSGTNDLHGSGWIYDTNSHFKARNFFQTAPQNPKDILNQFGFTLGGPVWIPKIYNGRNKLFFFTDWERTTRRQISPIRFYSLPTDALKSGNFSGVSTTIYDPLSNSDPTKRTAFPGNIIPANRIDPASATLSSILPAPNVTGSNPYVNNYVANGVGTTDRDSVDIKINYNWSEKLSLFGRYSIAPSNIFDPPSLGPADGDALNGGQLGNAPGRIQVGGAGLTYVFNPRVVMDINLGYTRQRLGAQNIDLDTNYGLDVLHIPGTNGPDRLQGGIPFFAVSNWANIGNSNTGNPFLFRDNQYVGSGNLSWIMGRHSLRFGTDYQNQQLNHFQPQGGTFQTARGTFQFSGQSTALQNGPSADRFNSWADFMLGDASAAGKVTQIINPDSVRMHTYALYAQDQWQATPKLTLTYGLRWEWYPFPRRDHGGVSRFDPATGNVYIGGQGSVPDDTYASSGPGEFLPRVGVAYRATETTVIRTGIGFSADPKPFIDFRNAYPIVIAGSMPAVQFNGRDNAFLPVTTLRQGLTAAGTGTVPDLSSGILKLPSTVGTTTFPKNAMRKYVESWNFIVEHQFGRDLTGQTGYVGTRAVGQESFVNINAGAPGLGNQGRLLYAPLGLVSDINDIMPFQTATYDSLQSQLTKRWSGSQIGAVYTWSKAVDWADNDANPRIQWPAAWKQNRGPSGFDRTHNFVTYFVLASPFGPGHRWGQSGIPRKLLGGWELNTVLTAQSGQPIYIVQNTANNLNASGSGQVPDLVKSNVAILGGIGVGHPYFDTTAFQAVNIPSNQPQRFGTSGRNNVRGPGFFNMDTGLFRTFAIRERFNIQFRAEALNLTNHSNFSFAGGNLNVSDPSSFGYITQTIGENGVTGTGERQFRFAARVFF